MDYFVPHFGADPEIEASLANEELASKMVKHVWGMGTKRHFEEYRNHALDTEYNFAPELDSDVKHTIAHTQEAENNIGSWEIAGFK